MVVPVVVVTGFGSIGTAVEAMHLGAVDYAEKPLIGDDLLERIVRGLESSPARSDRATLQQLSPASIRWARLVIRVVDSPTDIRSVDDCARFVAVSSSTLRDWCRFCRVSAGQSLDLARFIRAVHVAPRRSWNAADHFDVSDSRTLRHLLLRAGLPPTAGNVSLGDLMATQTFIRDAPSLAALRAGLTELHGHLTPTR
jgi:hypothetical protein